MHIIAHRGNVHGPNPLIENSPNYVLDAISQGYDAEIDVWLLNNIVFLGHDKPQYMIDEHFLVFNKDKLWCHAKNLDALTYLIGLNIRCFFHSSDAYTLTTCKHVWSYIGKPYNNQTIVVMPELSKDMTVMHPTNCFGLCTDYARTYKIRATATRRIAMVLSAKLKCWQSNLLPQIQTFYANHHDTCIDIYASVDDDDGPHYDEFVQTLQPHGFYVAKYVCDSRYTTWKNIRPEYETQPERLECFMSHAWNNKIARDMIKNITDYDRVVLFRTDLYTSDASLPDLSHPLKENVIYTPAKNIYGFNINNEILYGKPDVMSKYLEMVDHIDKYITDDNIILHSETLSYHHIVSNSIEYDTFVYCYDLDPSRRHL